MKRFIQWILSLLFPIKTTSIKGDVFDYAWEASKKKESEIFYGGQDGTTRRD